MAAFPNGCRWPTSGENNSLQNNKNNIIILIILIKRDATMNQSAIPAEIRERIIAAAVELYEQAGRESLPTVDQVRRAARADMNTTSAVMKEWRRQQTAQAAPVAVTVPEAVSQANTAALAELWQQAQELANESLRAAQAAWETERVDLDTMRAELADAYEAQAAELDQVRAAAEAAEQAHQVQSQQVADELDRTRQAVDQLRADLAQAVTRAERAEVKADEIERRAGDLRAELDRAHQDADQARASVIEAQRATETVSVQLDQVRAELAKVQTKAEAADESHQEQRKAAATEAHNLAERLTTAQAERDQAKQDAASARERAAGLAGQLTVHQEQAAALLARLAPAESPASTVAKKK